MSKTSMEKSTRGFGKAPPKIKKESDALEEETRRMEEQLKNVQEIVQLQRERDKTSGWSNASKEVPLRGYAKYVLEQKRKPPSKPKENTSKQKDSKDGTKRVVKDAKGENIISIKTKTTENPIIKKTETAVKKASLNLDKAKIEEDKEGYPEVDSFLDSVHLIKYKNLFINNGFEDLESILELQEEHFQIMEIPLGHKLKMLKRIRDLKGQNKKPESENPPIPPIPTIQEEVFDEEESHKAFLEAREEWLRGRKLASEEKNGMEKDSTEKPTMLAQLGGDTWNMAILPEFSEAGAGTSPKSSTIAPKKICCYQCFKLFSPSEGFSDPNFHREFCSEPCMSKFIEENSKQNEKQVMNKPTPVSAQIGSSSEPVEENDSDMPDEIDLEIESL